MAGRSPCCTAGLRPRASICRPGHRDQPAARSVPAPPLPAGTRAESRTEPPRLRRKSPAVTMLAQSGHCHLLWGHWGGAGGVLNSWGLRRCPGTGISLPLPPPRVLLPCATAAGRGAQATSPGAAVRREGGGQRREERARSGFPAPSRRLELFGRKSLSSRQSGGSSRAPGPLPGGGGVPGAGRGSRRDRAVLGPDVSLGPSGDPPALGRCCGRTPGQLGLPGLHCLGVPEGLRDVRGAGSAGAAGWCPPASGTLAAGTFPNAAWWRLARGFLRPFASVCPTRPLRWETEEWRGGTRSPGSPLLLHPLPAALPTVRAAGRGRGTPLGRRERGQELAAPAGPPPQQPTAGPRWGPPRAAQHRRAPRPGEGRRQWRAAPGRRSCAGGRAGGGSTGAAPPSLRIPSPAGDAAARRALSAGTPADAGPAPPRLARPDPPGAAAGRPARPENGVSTGAGRTGTPAPGRGPRRAAGSAPQYRGGGVVLGCRGSGPPHRGCGNPAPPAHPGGSHPPDPEDSGPR